MSIFQTSQEISETKKRQSGLFVDLHSLISNPQIPLQLHRFDLKYENEKGFN